MSVDYFAHAVYGVIPEGPAWAAFVDKLQEKQERLVEEDEEINEDESWYQAAVLARNEWPELWGAATAEAGAPDDAVLHFTGTEDDHPGRCDSGAESWVIGYGLFTFPREVPNEFMEVAEWHTWVTAS